MELLINDIKTYEMTGGRCNNHEHMLLLHTLPHAPEASIITTLQYIKENPLCQSYIGTEGLKDRQANTFVTQTIDWSAEQEVPYNIILTETEYVEQWETVATYLGISVYVVKVTSSAKHNLKALSRDIHLSRPTVIIAAYS